MPLSYQELRQRAADSRAKAAAEAKALQDAANSASQKAAAEAKALLDAANSASQNVAVLHVAFMAVCAYVLVIVFGTTDLDLLMGGNNVKLPVIDVVVPIVGFYAVAPYLVVLMHLNLLLQLQLLSRKLFAFDAVTPAEESVGGLRERLHIFPYTYYLVGRPGVVVGGLLGLVVSVSLIVLPLATLLALQLKFLAYQAEGITWAQRLAVFLDVGFLVALWPVILHPRDDWKAWWRETLAAHLPRKWAWLAVIVLFISVALVLFAATPDLFAVGLILGAAAPLLLVVLNCSFPREWLRRTIILIAVLLVFTAVLWVLMWDPKDSLSSIEPAIPIALFLGALLLAFFWHPAAPRGSLALLSALVLAPLLSLGLMVDGENWETATVATQKPLRTGWMQKRQRQALARRFETNNCQNIGHTVLSCVILAEQRRLDLNEQALFAKPPNPELLAALRAGKGLENKDKLEPISLVERSLRRAQMRSAMLVGTDLRGAQFQGADLKWAELQGANLSLAQLQGASLFEAQLQGANFSRAQLQGANFSRAQLQGANFSRAQLQGANLSLAQLQGANLSLAQLQGASLFEAQLQGAKLLQTKLQGTVLSGGRLEGAILLGAKLQGTVLSRGRLERANLFGAQLQGAVLRNSTLNRNGDPAQSDLLDVRGTSVMPLSREWFSEIQTVLKSIPFDGQANSLQRLEAAAEPGNAAPTFASCLTDGKSQPRCQQAYDATNLDQRHEFLVRLHEALATLSCEDSHIASGILEQISSAEGDSTRVGLATVLLARMKANEPCPGLASLSAEDKTKLEELARKEAERQQATKAAGTDQQ